MNGNESELLVAISQMMDTKLDGIRTELKGDIAGIRTELKGDIAGIRTELKGDIAGIRTELKGDIADLRTELKGDIADLRAELKGDIADLCAELKGDAVNLRTELKGDIAGLHQAFLETRMLIENDVLPRLNTIEACYTSTYHRYVAELDKMETLQKDVELLKKTSEKHSRQLQQLA